MKLSAFGEKFAGSSGIVELMDDLASALRENPQMRFMGGGNPAHLPQVESIFQHRLEGILQSSEKRHQLLGVYSSPQGDPEFRRELADYLNRQFGWGISETNITVTNGSQAAFFLLFNLLAGDTADGGRRHIHLPVVPEYIGYADIGLSEGFFTSTRPEIIEASTRTFKYAVDFDELKLDLDTAALCVSRPTNPTGNVLTDAEVEHLDAVATQYGAPLIIDGAYGPPFPNILFNEAKPYFSDNTVLVLSLSKLGLPGVRTGMVIANEEITRALANANTIASLATGTLGPALATELIRCGDLERLTADDIRPFYRQRAEQSVRWLQDAFERIGDDIPWRLHAPEGAFFLWLWLDGMPISSRELYERLKARNVLVVPGEEFFIGLQDWPHSRQCLRISYAQDEPTVREGLAIIAQEVAKAYR
ncbi:MAG: valine--pyruvate transaminase [Pseudomonadaceae bacterium]|nr:valine--pyruvate transaminase [Pseudomonadaceae bacterium]